MKLAFLIVLVPLVGCAHKVQTKLPDLEIPPACIKQAVMTQCDTSVNPPKCKSSRITYLPSSCAIVHLE
jgi:hypothetical protein